MKFPINYKNGNYNVTILKYGNKIRTTKTNTGIPVSRRVLLVDKGSMLCIGDTWSDASGNYTFYDVPVSMNCMVLSFDHTEVFDMAAHDKVRAE